MRPLLVGESYDGECLGLGTSSGRRLCSIMGLDAEEYLERFIRRNLCPFEWSPNAAQSTARNIIVNAMFGVGSSRIVMLGRRVADAFRDGFTSLGAVDVPRFELLCGYRFVRSDDEVTMVVLPHPSGRCRVWNEKKSIRRARRLLAEAEIIPLVPVFVPNKRKARTG
jgi:hypothetical protein